MNELQYFKEGMKNFSIFKIHHYVGRIAFYWKRHMYFRKLSHLQYEGLRYGTIMGGKETYLFHAKDAVLPLEMWISGRTYPEGEIATFFELVEDKYGVTVDSEEDIFLDIGANIGTTSVYVNKHILKKVIAFEPGWENYKLLVANSLLNECDGLVTKNVALSNREGMTLLKLDMDNPGHNKIIQKGEYEIKMYGKNDMEKVRMVVLDEYIRELNVNLEKVKYIWMDIEGHEPYAIQGMMELLRKRKIPMFMEFYSRWYDRSKFDTLYECLKEVYGHFVAISTEEIKVADSEIEKLEELYENDEFTGNIFLY